MVIKNGFIRTGAPVESPKPPLGEQKALLLRKGNELFNQGKYELAERIFVTLKYSDGIIRIGDVLLKQGQYLRAVRLYQKAPAPDRVEKLSQRMALVLRQWLLESAGE
jgi:hypothetical protein